MRDVGQFVEIAALFAAITTDVAGYERFSAAYPTLEALADAYETMAPFEQQTAQTLLTSRQPTTLFGRIAQTSYLSQLTGDPRFMRALTSDPELRAAPAAVRYFIQWQVLARAFNRRGSVDQDTAQAVLRSYRALLQLYARKLDLAFPLIPAEERDWDFVPIVTLQLLTRLHAPSADVLDYAARLVRMGKRPLLINSCLMPRAMAAPFFKATIANHNEGFEALQTMTHDGVTFDFLQCAPLMPDEPELSRIVRMLHAKRPGYVLSMGHSNLLADLCGSFTTTVGMPFGTDFQTTAASTYVLPRPWADGDEQAAASLALARDNVLATPYAFRLPDSHRATTRADLGASDTDILLAVVGSRLDGDATREWMEQLGAALDANPDVHVVFVGNFPAYEKRRALHPALERQTSAVGIIDDVPALLACCDLFLNPPRHGGGSTAAYALARGVPVLTDPTGDVAMVAGAAALPGLAQLQETLAKWRSDMAWRSQQQDHARQRWTQVSDRDSLLQGIDELARRNADRRAPVFAA
ncbi:glycosyltransferase [Roseiterribacter gracilis]|uniref:Glycosyltransferase n=1 Tax=Roseiterribacter gracilis TaxID=2812848 RepID=A0A8S8X6Z8_9PROT|nr:hypothetical protein TMPK1_10300 [Rhodospirillales bacterium TMPK1]